MNKETALEAMCEAVAECPRMDTTEETTKPKPETQAIGHPAYLVCTVLPLVMTAFKQAKGLVLLLSSVE